MLLRIGDLVKHFITNKPSLGIIIGYSKNSEYIVYWFKHEQAYKKRRVIHCYGNLIPYLRKKYE